MLHTLQPTRITRERPFSFSKSILGPFTCTDPVLETYGFMSNPKDATNKCNFGIILHKYRNLSFVGTHACTFEWIWPVNQCEEFLKHEKGIILDFQSYSTFIILCTLQLYTVNIWCHIWMHLREKSDTIDWITHVMIQHDMSCTVTIFLSIMWTFKCSAFIYTYSC